MRRKLGVLPQEAHARDCAIRAAIGRMLAAQYDLAEPLTDRLANLLNRLEITHEISAVGIQRQQFPSNRKPLARFPRRVAREDGKKPSAETNDARVPGLLVCRL